MCKTFFFNPFDSFYLNPTPAVYCKIIESLPGVDVVNIHNFESVTIQENSIIVFSPFTMIGMNEAVFNEAFTRLKKVYNLPDVDLINFELLNNYYRFFEKEIERCLATVSLLYEYDIHDFVDSPSRTRFFDRSNNFKLMAGKELYDEVIHQSDQNKDVPAGKYLAGMRYLTEYRNSIISFPHAVNNEEIKFDLLKTKKSRLFAVPGALYYYRKITLAFLRKFHTADFIVNRLEWIKMKFFSKVLSPKRRIAFLHKLIFNQIASADFNFTCGSTGGYFIRKFLEIPCYNSCLVTFEYSFLLNCGFDPEIHFIPVNDTNIESFVKDGYSQYDESRRSNIKASAMDLIEKKHSFSARKKQLEEILEMISDKKFNGSFWDRGEIKYY